jgi:hypothetical protein
VFDYGSDAHPTVFFRLSSIATVEIERVMEIEPNRKASTIYWYSMACENHAPLRVIGV